MTSWTEADVPDQTGRLAVVTGANSGLGLEVARVLAARGATVVLACRNPGRADAARRELLRELPAALVDVRPLDLADLASIAAFADGLAAEHDRLDLLVNNAGLMAVDEGRTADGFELQLGVNHLGHFALTARLLPLLDTHPRQPGRHDVEHGTRPRAAAPRRPHVHRPRVRPLAALLRQQAGEPALHAGPAAQARRDRRPTIAVSAHPGSSRTDLGREGTGLEPGDAGRGAVPTQSVRRGAGPPMPRAATEPAVSGGQFYGPRSWPPGCCACSTRRRLGPATRSSPEAAAGLGWISSPACGRVSTPTSRVATPFASSRHRRVSGLGSAPGTASAVAVSSARRSSESATTRSTAITRRSSNSSRLDEVERARDRVRGLQPEELRTRDVVADHPLAEHPHQRGQGVHASHEQQSPQPRTATSPSSSTSGR